MNTATSPGASISASGGTGATTLAGARVALNIDQATLIADASITLGNATTAAVVTTLTAARTITLPAAASMSAGQVLIIVDESGACSPVNRLTIQAAGTDTINATGSFSLTSAYASVKLIRVSANRWTAIGLGAGNCVQSLNGRSGAVALGGGDVTGALGFTPVNRAGDSFAGDVTIAGTAPGQIRTLSISNPATAAATAARLMFSTGMANAYAQIYLQQDSPSQATLHISASPALSGGVLFDSPISVAGPIRPASFTVATLPAPGQTGRLVYCSNARMLSGFGQLEVAGSGSGGLVTDNGSAWKLAGTNLTVSA